MGMAKMGSPLQKPLELRRFILFRQCLAKIVQIQNGGETGTRTLDLLRVKQAL